MFNKDVYISRRKKLKSLINNGIALFLGNGKGMGRSLWKWLALVALLTIALNALRLALMAAEPHTYEFLHDGAGAVIFRIIILSGAVGVAWLQSVHVAHKSLRIA